ncbi:hypothetical protein Nepgr_023092 [Nepenthes gracilis]|uniref:Uncharacterized protein n=1 Tax=Nepenthes gracilis TaxID=150966 RepID=A0AAD3T1U8_NEPGR|nr:hypothetical protein Nepgr_023092 [Nepenthes gracilis]
MLVSGTFDIAELMECGAVAHGCYLAALDNSGCCVGCYFGRSGEWSMLRCKATHLTVATQLTIWRQPAKLNATQHNINGHKDHCWELNTASSPFTCPCFRSSIQQGISPHVYHHSISRKHHTATHNTTAVPAKKTAVAASFSLPHHQTGVHHPCIQDKLDTGYLASN